MNQRTAKPLPDSLAPTPQELFDRLSQVASDLSDRCTRVEDSIADMMHNPADVETTALQDLDRMTQNLFELSKLMKRLSLSEHDLPQNEILEALQTVMLPSLRTFLEDGTEQAEQGSVDLF